MRPPSNRLLNRALTVTRRAWTRDVAGGKVAATAAVATLPGTLQQVRADRVPDHLRASGKVDCVALFRSDPVLQVDDLVADGATVMSVAAPAVDEAGRGYWVAYGTRKA
jgi:hypothetical protein